MEWEPQSRFNFNLGEDGVFPATPGNSMIYRHQHPDDAMFDHIYLITDDDPEHPDKGYFVFRRGVEGAGHDFDDLVERMEDAGWEPVEQEQVADGDRAAYFSMYEAELKTQELTIRQARFVDYFSYLLAHDHLTVADFEPAGELHI